MTNRVGTWAPTIEAVKRALCAARMPGSIVLQIRLFFSWADRLRNFGAAGLFLGSMACRRFCGKGAKIARGHNNPSKAPFAHIWGKADDLYWDSDGNNLEIYQNEGR